MRISASIARLATTVLFVLKAEFGFVKTTRTTKVLEAVSELALYIAALTPCELVAEPGLCEIWPCSKLVLRMCKIARFTSKATSGNVQVADSSLPKLRLHMMRTNWWRLRSKQGLRRPDIKKLICG